MMMPDSDFHSDDHFESHLRGEWDVTIHAITYTEPSLNIVVPSDIIFIVTKSSSS